MNTCLASIAAAVVLSAGAAVAPGIAQAETFNAWGHEFTVPGSRSDAAPATPPTAYTAMPTEIVGSPGSRSNHRDVSRQAHGSVHDMYRR